MAHEAEGRQYPRAKIRWLVSIKSAKGQMEGVTLNVSPSGVFISCSKPLRLNEVFEMRIDVPERDQPLKARAEVVWSNIYGPDDEITPRGMGVQFLQISSEDRQIIAKAVLEHLKSKKADPRFMETLKTIVVDVDKK